MSFVFLIGGGWQPESYPSTYGRFVKASTVDNQRKIVLVIAEEPGLEEEATNMKYRQVFESLGVASHEIVTIYVSETQLLTEALLVHHQPTGIFICGGLTPFYHHILCSDTQWCEYVLSRGISYGGFSAGAAIAADQAIVGGWKIHLNDQEVPILDADLAEELEFLTVRPGLGLVSFAVDVHGSQWGTLSRLLHAVDQEMVPEGWVIDENTMLFIDNEQIQVFGLGQAYYVHHHTPGKILVEIFRDGSFYLRE